MVSTSTQSALLTDTSIFKVLLTIGVVSASCGCRIKEYIYRTRNGY